MILSLHRWIRISLLNLLIVATIGIILRYKIAFSLPFVDQKHLLHGHSHFAFTGWVTQILMVLMVYFLSENTGRSHFKKYNRILIANLITAYGMLFSFPFQGYGLFSITFSTLSIFVSYLFAVMYWKDLNKILIKTSSHWWFKAALLFNAISSFGAFGLAIMMATKNIHQNWYLASVYFFLHFQYNGWFFFSCIGLIIEKIFPGNCSLGLQRIFWLFALSCVPAYFLSALWMELPFWLYILVVCAAFAQIIAWIMLLNIARVHISFIKKNISFTAKWLLCLTTITFSIKFILQLGSTIPSLSILTFGFRPIVVGYLHLVLLGCITLTIFGYLVATNLICFNKVSVRGIIIFTAGIFINEILLMTQGFSAINYINVPLINESLLFAALIMFTGLLFLNISQKNISESDFNHKKSF